MDNSYLFSSSNTIFVNKKIIDFMGGDCVALLVLYAYIDSYKYYCNEEKLQDDDSFYSSNTKILEFLHISRKKMLRCKAKLISMGLLTSVQKRTGEASYIKLNHELLRKIYGEEAEKKQETKIIEINKITKIKPKKTEEEDAKVVKLWNEKVVGNFKYIPKLKKLNAENRKLFKARLKESGLSMEEFFDDLVTHVGKSTYLQGLNDHNWSIDFNWAMKPGKYSIIVDDIWRDKTNKEKEQAIDDYVLRNWKE